MNHHPGAWGQTLTPHQRFDQYSSMAPSRYHASAAAGIVSNDHGFYDASQGGSEAMMAGGVVSHTQQPLVTGTSVLGLVFADGVMLAADNLASYGSLARFRDIQRLVPLESTKSSSTCLAVGGDMSDFQYLQRQLESMIISERTQALGDDHPTLGPKQIYEYLSNLMYARRSKMDPLWNSMLLGGVKDGESFLGYVDLLGTTYSAPTLASGFGSHMAQPLLREAYEKRQAEGQRGEKQGELMSREEATAVLEDCMKVLYYRDARSLNKYQIATITADGVDISASKTSETQWKFAEGLRGYGPQKQ
ncbi:hypothetical protein NliqN6_4313 [Naganishia liquefaciens]|uniref:Proteasome subunit beta n=1 Tax=Naganishia liquefaciens TaxID=104408 RepID=A0A8H3YHS9_9TREE|nr:hypothetical protein NliqN6_4313 [Naganishia liquefaciens]